jgi:hypothetical protein
MNRHPHTLVLSLLVLLMLTACQPQMPIIIYVTPTPQATDAPTLAPITSTYTSVPPAETSVGVAPTTGALETATVFAPVSTLTPGGTPNVIGSVLQPGYTLPPSSTPRPTDTLPPTQTPEPGAPTPTPAPATPTLTPTLGAPPVFTLPTLDPNRVGMQLDINLSDADWDAAMADIERLGAKWVKVQLPWRDMQPNGPDERDNEFFRRIEQHLEDANRRGLNMLVSVVKAPPWARSVQAEDGPPDDPQALANFITLIFEEFNAGLNRALVGDYIDAIEIWNEPNLQREWQGTLPFSGAGYMRLFAPAYAAVRAYSPTIPIITAGLAPTGNSPFSVNDRDFLQQMYDAGLAQYGDIFVGGHPYGWANPPDARCCGTRGWDDDPHFFFLDNMDSYREIMNRNGHQAEQMWITEIGFASWDGYPPNLEPPDAWMGFTDRWQQGGYTLRMLEISQARGDTGVVFLWNLNFAMLSGLITGRDERSAYSLVVPGSSCAIDAASTSRTERAAYWMLYDALRPEVQLNDFCGIPPNPIPGLQP